MHRISSASYREGMLPLLTLVFLIACSPITVSAFADSKITDYSAGNMPNPYYQEVRPYHGEIWATNIPSSNNTTPQYLQAENWNIEWDSQAAANIRSGDLAIVGPVFHVFQQGTACNALPFTYDGYFESNQPDAFVQSKSASCGGPYGGYSNEARVYWHASNVVGSSNYYGGVEFQIGNGDLSTPAPGKVSNDIYMNGNSGEYKFNVSNGTWCFTAGPGQNGC